LTRHDLKDQLQHDQFTDAVSNVVTYTQTHRQQVIRWSVVGAVVLLIAGAVGWYVSSQRAQRQQDLSDAMSVVDAQVGPGNNFSKTYPTQDAKDAAATKALSDVVAKDGSSKEGMIALYYLSTLKAKADQGAAEPGFKKVADSGTPVTPLAKIALAQIYVGQGKLAPAQDLLRSIINNPTDLVSKAQAQILLAQTEATSDPKDARAQLKMISADAEKRAAVSRAADAVAAQLK
jgi:hypothetical protein